uniref:DUF4808 domain-containing protein n=1 Tax=Macrostomum lignano TaxID=282301 RepID=A0A1I8FRY2_9PLAT
GVQRDHDARVPDGAAESDWRPTIEWRPVGPTHRSSTSLQFAGAGRLGQQTAAQESHDAFSLRGQYYSQPDPELADSQHRRSRKNSVAPTPHTVHWKDEQSPGKQQEQQQQSCLAVIQGGLSRDDHEPGCEVQPCCGCKLKAPISLLPLAFDSLSPLEDESAASAAKDSMPPRADERKRGKRRRAKKTSDRCRKLRRWCRSGRRGHDRRWRRTSIYQPAIKPINYINATIATDYPSIYQSGK